jgi:hypothetical protein
LVIGDLALMTEDWRHTVTMVTPQSVKLNAAFTEDADRITAAASHLTGLGYTLCGAYWRNDNSFGYRILERVDALSGFQPTPWTNLNLIGYKNKAQAEAMVRFGRFYAGQEARIGELQIAKAVRTDYITQLETAMIELQKREGSVGE